MDLPFIVNFLEVELQYCDMRTMRKTRGQHPQTWNHMEHVDNDIMMVDVPTITTERMRPGARDTDEMHIMEDMEEATLEEQNESMMEGFSTTTDAMEYMGVRREPLRVRPRLGSNSSDEAPRRH
eukprot:4802872-Heterocapsa_arctica.AAC.1